jgi:hypothetical protein
VAGLSEGPVKPSAAERARTLLARSRVGTLHTTGARTGPIATVVAVLGDPRGRPVIWLDERSPALADLDAFPAASLCLSPEQLATLVIDGTTARVSPPSRSGQIAVRLQPSSVHLTFGSRKTVDLDAYNRARADPLRREAPEILAHLRTAHTSELLTCLRAQFGSNIEHVDPRQLDRHGLEVVILNRHGVGIARLAFPRPVSTLHDLGPGLSAVLCCRCRPR